MPTNTPRSIAEALRELAAELRDVAVTWADDMPSRAYADFRAIADRLETQALATANGAEDRGGMPEYVIALLIAAGWVTQAKVDEARKIALGIVPGRLATRPQAASDGEGGRDAARYRFLRDVGPPGSDGYPTILQWKLVVQHRHRGTLLFGKDLDAAIDAAMTTDAAKGDDNG